ncbi:hypothetical protein OAF54_00775 [bacterium]|nr:hypothetical protein [bacterium]
MTLASCIISEKIDGDDAKEFRRLARETGGEAAGVQEYIAALQDDKRSLRDQLNNQGFDMDVQISTEIDDGRAGLKWTNDPDQMQGKGKSDFNDSTMTIVDLPIEGVMSLASKSQRISLDATVKSEDKYGNFIGDRVNRAKEFWADGGGMDPSEIGLGLGSQTSSFLDFGNGRHRLVAAHQLGATHAPFFVKKRELFRINELLGPSQPKTSGDLFQNDTTPDGDHPARISTRIPSVKKPVEDAVNENLIIDVEAMKAKPEAFAHNMELVKNYPGFSSTSTDPDVIAEEFIQHAVDNLLWLHDQIPADTRARSHMWYSGARNITTRLASDHGIPDQAVAAVMAALSPQKDWFQNASLGERLIDIHQNFTSGNQTGFTPDAKMRKEARRIFGTGVNNKMRLDIIKKSYSELESSTEKAMWLRIYDEAHNPRSYRTLTPEGEWTGEASGKAGWGSLVEIRKGIEALEDPSKENLTRIMGGKHKVRNFYNNILAPDNPHGDVTIDTHAVAAALLQALSGASVPVMHNFGSSPGIKKQPEGWVAARNIGTNGAQGTYGIYAEAYRRAAAERGILPREMQSITWEAVRGLFPAKFKQQAKNVDAINNVWHSVDQGLTSIQEAREQILSIADGISDPAWIDTGSTVDAETQRASYDGELVAARIPRRDAGRVATGGGNPTGAATTDLSNLLFQTENAVSPLGFSSAAHNAVTTFKEDSGTAKQWRKRLDDNVKKTELDTIVGLDEMLKATGGRISKEEMMAFIEQNGVYLDEVVLSNDKKDPQDLIDAKADMEDAKVLAIDTERNFVDTLRDELIDKGMLTNATIVNLIRDNVKERGPSSLEDMSTEVFEAGQAYFIASGEWRVSIDNYIEVSEGRPEEHTVFARSYALPGGENQREFYLTLPRDVNGNTQIEDWLVPGAHQIGNAEADNRLAVRIRVNDRIVDGKRILFIEEMQGDRQQEARDRGGFKKAAPTLGNSTPRDIWNNDPDIKRFSLMYTDQRLRAENPTQFNNLWDQVYARNAIPDSMGLDEFFETLRGKDRSGRPPSIPWGTDSEWGALALKRVLLKAVEEGYDSVAWTPGSVQIDRYTETLRQNVDEIIYEFDEEDGTYGIEGVKGGKLTYGQDGLGEQELVKLLGKPITKQIIEDTGNADHDMPLRPDARVISGDGLSIGGEGMINFYDRVVPNIAKKLGKKFGAKVSTTTINAGPKVADRNFNDEIRQLEGGQLYLDGQATLDELQTANPDFEFDQMKEVWAFEITEKMRDSIQREGLPLFQDKKDTGPRGSINLSDLSAITIKLFETANKSTLLHETGHLHVALLEMLANDPNASERVKETWKRMQKWVFQGEIPDEEIEQRLADGTLADLMRHTLYEEGTPERNRAVKLQEQLARAFEAYLMEGKAPSVELQGSFRLFSSWMTDTYKDVKALNVDMDPEIRAIFDRMLATEAQVTEAEEINKLRFNSNTTPAGTEQEMAALEQQASDAHAEAVEQLIQDRFKMEQRATEKWWKEEKEETRADVEAAYWAEPANRAFYFLTKGEFKDEETLIEPFKLDEALLLEMTPDGKEGLAKLRKNGVINVYTKEGGLHPDVAAQQLGFESGAKLIDALDKQEKSKPIIDQRTKEAMAAKHGDPLNDGSLMEAATEHVYSDKKRMFIVAELDALAKRTGQPPTRKQAIKAIVDRMVDEESVGSMMAPAKFMNNMIRNVKRYEKAVAEEDWDTAFTQKQQQLINFELHRASLKAQKNVAGIRKYFKKFLSKTKTFKGIEADYVDTIKIILDNYDVGVQMSQAKRDALTQFALVDWMERKAEDDGAIFFVPQEILDADRKMPFRDMSYGEFLGLNAAIKNVEQQGRNAKKGIRGRETVIKDGLVAEMVETMGRLDDTSTAKDRKTRAHRRDRTKVGDFFTRWNAHMLKTEFLLEHIDGSSNGAAKKSIFQPFVDAEFEENKLARKNGLRFAAAFDRISKDIIKQMDKEVFIERLGRYYRRSDLLHMALNVGNSSNFDKMVRGSEKIEGINLTEDNVMQTLNETLTKEEWELVQTVWDMFEEMYPRVEEVYRNENGVSPVKIDPAEVVTPHGTFKGGYFPMIYDPKQTPEVEAIEDKSALEAMQNEMVQASVFSGMTKARSEAAAFPVLLDITRVAGELQKTAHFITHYEPVRNARKIIGDPQFAKAVTDKIGKEHYDILKTWVGQVALGHREKPKYSVLDDLVETLRGNATVAIMGGFLGSVTTMATQPLGAFTAMDTLARGVDEKYSATRGTVRMIKGLTAMINGGDAKKEAMRKSKELQFRLDNADRDIKHATSKVSGVTGKKAPVQRMLLVGIPFIQLYTVDIPTWIAAHQMGVDKGMSDADAVEFADSRVRMSQGSGSAKDQAAMMAQRGASRAYTMFMTFFNTMYNIQARLVREAAWTPEFANKVVAGGILMYVLPSMVEALFRMQGPDEDDEESYAEFIAMKTAFFAMSSIPVVRDTTAAFERGRRFSSSPMTGLFENTARTVQTVGDLVFDYEKAEISDSELKSIINMAGFATGVIPSTYINRLIGAYNKMEDEGEINPWEFFIGPVKDD